MNSRDLRLLQTAQGKLRSSSAYHWLRERGVTDEEIDRYQLGAMDFRGKHSNLTYPAVTIPILRSDQSCAGWIARLLGGKQKYFIPPNFPIKSYTFPWDAWREIIGHGFCIVTEGVFDAFLTHEPGAEVTLSPQN